MKWEYTVSTNTIWTSFDYGEVEAEHADEARELAKVELDKNFKLVNEALKANPTTKSMDIDYSDSQIQVKPKK